jgi:4-methylaminobutanoate oxidase (formaldehyde-forming)
MTLQEIEIGYALVNALRITNVGELVWELYIPTEFSPHVFDRLVAAVEDFDLKHVGMQAPDSLRLEKGYRDYRGDSDNTDTPLEVGVGRFLQFEKPGGFIGRDALLRLVDSGYQYRTVQSLPDDPEPLLHYGKIIYRD